MSRRRFWNEIITNLQPGENPQDVAAMIDILAAERRNAVGPREGEDEVSFAAAIICIILKPFKPPDYVQKMAQMRTSFRGISASGRLQSSFRSYFTPALLFAPDAQQAFRQGFDVLFS